MTGLSVRAGIMGRIEKFFERWALSAFCPTQTFAAIRRNVSEEIRCSHLCA